MWEEDEPRASKSGTTIRMFEGGYKGRPVDEVVHVSKRRGRRFKFQGKEKAKRSQHIEGITLDATEDRGRYGVRIQQEEEEAGDVNRGGGSYVVGSGCQALPNGHPP